MCKAFVLHRDAIQDSAAAANGPQGASSVIAIKEHEERRKELKVRASACCCYVRGSIQWGIIAIKEHEERRKELKVRASACCC